MSVLDNLRKGTDSASVRVLILVVAAAMIVFFAQTDPGQPNQAGAAATVNGETITRTEWGRAVQAAEQQARANGQPLDNETLARDTLEELVNQELSVQAAVDMGLAVDPSEVGRLLRGMKAFQKDGKFDKAQYEKLLRQRGETSQKFELDLQRALFGEKMAWLAGQAVQVTEAEIKAAWTEMETSTTLSWVAVPRSAIGQTATPTDAEVADLLAKDEARVKKAYDDAFAVKYDLPKTWALSAIVLRTDLEGMDESAKKATKAKAEEIHAQLVAGAAFGALARRWSEDASALADGALGAMAENQIEAGARAAVTAATAETLTAVLETTRGYEIYRVGAITEARKVPFDEVKAGIAREMLTEDKAGPAQKALADQVLAAWKDPTLPPVDVLAPLGLEMRTTEPFNAQRPPMVPPVSGNPALAIAVATAPKGTVLPGPFEVGGTLYLVGIADRAEPDPARYESARALLRARLLAERRNRFFEEWLQAERKDALITMGAS